MFVTPVQAQYEVPAFSTMNFELISPLQILNKDTGTKYSLMGLKNPSQNVDLLRQLNQSLAGAEIFCTVYTTGTWCNLKPSDQILAQVIINNGLAIEDCEATQGQFGTCEVDQ
tara:strand:- start:153 stop:491 length:339 start_codon:yes stop_codon:yes gene_type:complete